MKVRVATIGRVGRMLMVCALLGVIASAATSASGAHTFAASSVRADDARKEVVVLVHGMGRTRVSMWLMGRSLERQGYRVVNFGYASTADSIPALGEALTRVLAAETARAPRVHFVGHSLGNIIVRWTLANRPPPHVGRVVMLAPPNQGARAADRYARALGWLMPPIRELRTLPAARARTIPLPGGVDVGVIAGAEDGKVTVAESHLEGEREHVVVPAAHTFIMNRGDVQRLVARFLRTGSFGDGLARPAHPARHAGV